ncbi:hypothetical protein N5079_19930 [Planotetraspora sp. A-T 1434]|uniref:hypothetical protein n=1 Tax=Planotetraspora sp. A-T 1434 TaxID=2979219 RepID=UPI0021C07624|nr:hypothetical protein [Planotetraspora sp. A-T 1434]MCT9932475.1 hypothetical protein [Planotetraspora sp. A-T 1434]
MLHNRWVKVAAIAFIAFYLFTRPTQAGNTVQGAIDKVQTGADRIATFFTAVMH